MLINERNITILNTEFTTTVSFVGTTTISTTITITL